MGGGRGEGVEGEMKGRRGREGGEGRGEGEAEGRGGLTRENERRSNWATLCALRNDDVH